MARHRSIPVLHREQFQVGFLDGQRNHESITSKGGRHANLLHLEPAVLFFHGKLKPEASGISPHWIVAAKAVAGTLSAVRVKCPSPETPICWVVDHAEVYLDRYQYRSRAKKSWIRCLRITVEQKLSTSVWSQNYLLSSGWQMLK